MYVRFTEHIYSVSYENSCHSAREGQSSSLSLRPLFSQGCRVHKCVTEVTVTICTENVRKLKKIGFISFSPLFGGTV